MILKIENIDLSGSAKFLSEKVSTDKHEFFKKGFAYTSTAFFNILTVVAFCNIVEPGVYDVDLDYVANDCYRDIEPKVESLKLSEVDHFLAGANSAIETCVKYVEMCCFDSVNKISV